MNVSFHWPLSNWYSYMLDMTAEQIHRLLLACPFNCYYFWLIGRPFFEGKRSCNLYQHRKRWSATCFLSTLGGGGQDVVRSIKRIPNYTTLRGDKWPYWDRPHSGKPLICCIDYSSYWSAHHPVTSPDYLADVISILTAEMTKACLMGLIENENIN